MLLTCNAYNNEDIAKMCNYFAAVVQKSPNAIIVGYDTYKELNIKDIKNLFGLDILVDFNIKDFSCNLCMKV